MPRPNVSRFRRVSKSVRGTATRQSTNREENRANSLRGGGALCLVGAGFEVGTASFRWSQANCLPSGGFVTSSLAAMLSDRAHGPRGERDFSRCRAPAMRTDGRSAGGWAK